MDKLTTSLDIVAPIMHFTARDSDLTVYLLGVSKLNKLFLHIVTPGNLSNPKPYHKTYKFHSPLQLGWQFSNIKAIRLVLGESTDNLYFYSADFIGEILNISDNNLPMLKLSLAKASERATEEVVQISEGLVVPTTDSDYLMYVLLKETHEGKTSLRIDALDAHNLRGSAQNVVRINTIANAAYLLAAFAEVAVSEHNSHIFASFAF